MMMYLIGAIVLLCLIIVVVLLVPGTDKKRKMTDSIVLNCSLTEADALRLAIRSTGFWSMAGRSPARQNQSANLCWSSS